MTGRKFIWLFICMTALFFYGCGAAAVGGAAFGGYKGATDERSLGTIVDDSLLSTTVKTKLLTDDFIKSRHIDVDVLNGVVYLIGVVESASQKRMAGDIARSVEGVRHVKNQLMVGRTTAGQILDDALLSSKIQTELIKTPNVRSTNIDVDVNNNVVTLTGIISSFQEKQIVLNVTRRVIGNRRIVDNLRVAN